MRGAAGPPPRLAGMASLDLLLAARRVGLVLSGGSVRCAFQIGVIEALDELGVRPALCVAVSGGVWNGAAVAAGTAHRLRLYWRAFSRMPALDLRNLLREHSPWAWNELHRRTFRRYVGAERLCAAGALPLWVGVTRLADRRRVLFEARQLADPLPLLLASNYLPPFFTHAPRLGGVRYGDGGMTDNLPYDKAFEEGCDAVVAVTMKGESEGGLYRSPAEVDHVLPPDVAARTVVIRPRHRLPVAYVERRWPVLAGLADLGRLRAREVLLGEEHPETQLRADGRSPTARLARLASLVGALFGG
jgi:predicted acylesterase/phospholipase RssA